MSILAVDLAAMEHTVDEAREAVVEVSIAHGVLMSDRFFDSVRTALRYHQLVVGDLTRARIAEEVLRG